MNRKMILEFGDRERKLDDIYKEIQEVYFLNNYPWIIGYSGGKDSTAVLQLVWEALERVPKDKLNKPVYIISSDTLVEIPKVVNHLEKSLELINIASETRKLPFKAIKVKPDISNTFWVNLIGRGYAAPTNDFRWCTDRLKIKPANKFIIETVSEYGEVIVVLGVRKSESISREKTINEHKIKDNILSRHTTMPGAYVYTPIEDWSVEDVWSYLLNFKSPWGNDNYELFKMYKQANAGECPVIIGDDASEFQSCGNSRFGCWVCTVVKNEKSLSSLIENGEDWLKPLQEFRNLLVETQNPDVKHIYRDYKRRNGTVYFKNNIDGTIEIGRGPYKFEFRKELLRKLLETEKKIKQTTEYEINLILLDEIIEIQRIWQLEEGDWEQSAFEIYKDVYGENINFFKDDLGIFTVNDKLLIYEMAERYGINPKMIIKLLNTYQNNKTFTKSSIVKTIEEILNEEWRTEEEILEELKNKKEVK